MNKRSQEYFVFGVAVTSFVAAMLVLLSATGTGHILDDSDPFLFLSSRQVFYLVGGLGFVLSAFLLVLQNRLQTKLLLIAWLSTSFLVYKIGLSRTNEPNYFSCLGNLDEMLQISPKAFDRIASIILILMLGGSCAFLTLDWINYNRANREVPPQNLKNDEVKKIDDRAAS